MVSTRNIAVPRLKADRFDDRHGLTLTELLVVIAILVVVTSVLAPLLTTSLDGREVREAARQVNAYFQQAQQKAKELGRPIGVAIHRGPTEGPDFGYQLSLVEQPPPFRGFMATDRVHIDTTDLLDDGFFTAYVTTAVSAGSGQADPAFLKFVQANDQIRLNYRGPKYRIILARPTNPSNEVDADYPDSSFAVLCEAKTEDLQKNLRRFASYSSIEFDVYRRPRMTSSTPLELPAGTAIVMNLSGVGMDYASARLASNNQAGPGVEGQIQVEAAVNPLAPRQKYIGMTEFQRMNDPVEILPFTPTVEEFQQLQKSPLTIMFSPDGTVDRVYRILPPQGLAALPPKRPQDKIYLFLGKDAATREENFEDTTNLWIAIDPANGLISSAPHLPPTDADGTVIKLNSKRLAAARQTAATGQSMGGQ